MRILIIAHDFPYPLISGSKLKLFNILRELSQRHELYLLTFADPTDYETYYHKVKRYCHEIEFVQKPQLKRRSFRYTQFLNIFEPYPMGIKAYQSWEMHKKIQRILSNHKIDVVHVDMHEMAQYIIELKDYSKIIAPHDAHTLLIEGIAKRDPRFLRRLYMKMQAKKTARYEADFYSQFDGCFVVSHRDKDALDKLCPNLQIEYAPNGVDLEYYHAVDVPPVYPSLIFTGTMNYAPNFDAAIYLCSEILPLIRQQVPEIKVFVVGANPLPEIKELGSQNVIVTGEVEDIRPYVSQSTIYVSPIRMGSGIKNKILEAMAMGKAIVATSLSCEGIEVKSGHDLLVADRAEEIASCVMNLINNKEQRRLLEQNALKKVRQYTWDRPVRILECLYEKVSEKSAMVQRTALKGQDGLDEMNGKGCH